MRSVLPLLLALGLVSGCAGASEQLRVGAVAPDFSLPDTKGRPVTLAGLREQGPVILAFFPKAFTPG